MKTFIANNYGRLYQLPRWQRDPCIFISITRYCIITPLEQPTKSKAPIEFAIHNSLPEAPIKFAEDNIHPTRDYQIGVLTPYTHSRVLRKS
jgi:hypothetical protein